MYQHNIAFFVSWYSDILDDTVQCVLADFYGWTESFPKLYPFRNTRAIKLAAILYSISHEIQCINVDTSIYHNIQYIDMIWICINTVALP